MLGLALYEKRVYLGKIRTPGYTKSSECHLEVTLRQVREGLELSIIGILSHPTKKEETIGAGQIQDSLKLEHFTSLAIPKERLLRIREIWQRWHLNAMRAECAHQRELGWTYSDHPSEPCPECGYRLGSAWLFEPLPLEIIDEVKSW